MPPPLARGRVFARPQALGAHHHVAGEAHHNAGCTVIVAAARRVLGAVPVEQRERPEAGDLRELLAIEQKA
ncbi:hypothetical protein AB0L53_40830 [Nonomuraea sp. NPDC052129]|uniref:hypothetical protein n=1 Tax=Nonomuraea sp. NPDC052129 TaxID=3154651 RepID=UPI0034465373